MAAVKQKQIKDQSELEEKFIICPQCKESSAVRAYEDDLKMIICLNCDYKDEVKI